MRILITGSAGMLGQDVVREAGAAGHEALAFPRAQLDIADRSAVQRVIDSAAPEVVINCAAWTNVDGAESQEGAALEVNGGGAGHVARAASSREVWTIHVSSDYVFDGNKGEPYVESDPTAPLSAYGRTKLAGEQEVAREAPASHTIVRSSWLFGVGGPCFPATIQRLASERDELTVVDDQIGCPTFTGHLAQALVELASPERRLPGIVHVAADEDCSWFRFAQRIVELAGLSCELMPGRTADVPRPAPRPAYSVLRSERGAEVPRLPDWHEGLREYMSKRMAAGGARAESR